MNRSGRTYRIAVIKDGYKDARTVRDFWDSGKSVMESISNDVIMRYSRDNSPMLLIEYQDYATEKLKFKANITDGNEINAMLHVLYVNGAEIFSDYPDLQYLADMVEKKARYLDMLPARTRFVPSNKDVKPLRAGTWISYLSKAADPEKYGFVRRQIVKKCKEMLF